MSSSDTPRTDARLGHENQHHGANMLCRELERELAAMTADRDEQRAGWDKASLTALRLERERNEARECLREAIYCFLNQSCKNETNIARWRKAAGLE